MYTCAMCGAESETLDGWLAIRVGFCKIDPADWYPPNARTIQAESEFLFDTEEHRQAWCNERTIEVPAIGMPPPEEEPG